MLEGGDGSHLLGGSSGDVSADVQSLLKCCISTLEEEGGNIEPVGREAAAALLSEAQVDLRDPDRWKRLKWKEEAQVEGRGPNLPSGAFVWI